MPTVQRPREINAWSAAVFWLTGALVAALVLAAWQAVSVILLAFASAIFATMLIALARPMERYLGLSRRFAVPIAGVVLLAVPVVATLLIGPELKAQLADIGKAVPAAIQSIERTFNINFQTLIDQATGTGNSQDQAASGGRNLISDAVGFAQMVWSNLSTAGSFVISGVAGLLVVIAGGVYLATDLDRHRRGVVRLFPKSQHSTIDTALGTSGRALERWLRAQLVAMVSVGVLIGLGAWIIGLPAPLAIGFINGFLEFFPIIGPWLGAVPVMLLAVGQGPQMILFAALLLLLIQQLEANVITPLAQERMADIPPFVVLFGLLMFGMVFGLIGVIVAGPLTLVAYVLIGELYMKETLGQEIEVPGSPEAVEHEPREESATTRTA